jgi:hypothetical protein
MGFIVEYLSIKPDPTKVDMLNKAKQPKSVKDLQAFLGLLQFYKGMLPHLAHTAHPLYAATSEKFTFQWTEKLNEAFKTVKSMLVKQVMQSELVGDKNIEVLVDASKFAVCVVLRQGNRIIFCASKVLNPAQRNWSTVERELFAAAWGIKKLRSYIYGKNFTLLTDHKPLVGLLAKQGEAPNNRIQIMLLSLGEYDFSVKHLPGTRNIIADYGTRHIENTEWDKPQSDDPEGLHELLVMEREIEDNDFSKTLHTLQDKEDIERLKLESWEQQGIVMVKVGIKTLIWLPIKSRRAMFWKKHTNKHIGKTKILESLKKDNIYWHNAAKEVQQLLSQCLCAIKR